MANRLLSRLLACVLLFASPLAYAGDTTSTLLKLLIMGTGLHNNDWGAQTNTNLQAIESAIAGIGSYSVSGGTLTLTDAQALPAALAFTGTLSSNQTVILPNHSRVWIVFNSTSGAYTLTLKAAGAGTTINVAQGTNRIFISDGTNVYDASPPVVDSVPVGVMLHYAGPNGGALPTNYKYCDGTALSRTTYGALFYAIGGMYGAGDGSTTFNLPDARGRVVAAPDSGTGRLYGWGIGQAGGEATHTLTTAEMPIHHHNNYDSGHNHTLHDPGHGHYLPYAWSATTAQVGSYLSQVIVGYGGANNFAVQSNTTGISLDSGNAVIVNVDAGGNGAHNVVQPTIVANCIIRVQ